MKNNKKEMFCCITRMNGVCEVKGCIENQNLKLSKIKESDLSLFESNGFKKIDFQFDPIGYCRIFYFEQSTFLDYKILFNEKDSSGKILRSKSIIFKNPTYDTIARTKDALDKFAELQKLVIEEIKPKSEEQKMMEQLVKDNQMDSKDEENISPNYEKKLEKAYNSNKRFNSNNILLKYLDQKFKEGINDKMYTISYTFLSNIALKLFDRQQKYSYQCIDKDNNKVILINNCNIRKLRKYRRMKRNFYMSKNKKKKIKKMRKTGINKKRMTSIQISFLSAEKSNFIKKNIDRINSCINFFESKGFELQIQ